MKDGESKEFSTEEADLLERSIRRSKEQEGRSVVSYKDSLLHLNGGSSEEKETEVLENLGFEEDEESQFMEECNQSVDDPFCPSYRFEKEIHKESCKPWRMAVIVKLLGKRVGVKFFQNRLLKMWNLSGSYEFIDMENDYFLFRFDKIEDYNFVLQEGPWIVADHYVMVQRWRPFFNPHDDDFKKLAVWLRIPGLPIEFYTSKHLCNIGNLFGRTLKIDRNSIRKDIIGDKEFTDRAKFARICVEVDLRKGFLSKFKIGNRVFPVGYEGLHLVCFACGRYGHRRDSCPTLAPASTSTINQSTQIHTTMANTTVQHKVAMEGEAFGSWMLVQRN
ncbi:uncharacterized protein LOC133295303 [Gastrolobium bilobum]|uniref:uncharacterized protein LOC133295303 n=1 Tax=Gastrolobium bilobum TaxID=150636 RepID=UPI002AB13660|nr:uncharacterized protein LOC133295303 [Gastrolobium bilobum]